jgi:hypothetical protein
MPHKSARFRLDDDLGQIIEQEAARVGMSVPQFVREAALARASAAIDSRGTGDFRALGAAARHTLPLGSPDRTAAELVVTRLGRSANARERAAMSALLAEGRQAMRKSKEQRAAVQRDREDGPQV